MTKFFPHVVVVGGGFAGLEAAFYLRKRVQEHINITLISDKTTFTLKPNSVYIPFGLDPERLLIDLDRATRRKGIHFAHHQVISVDPEKHWVYTENDDHYRYDALILATGARTCPEAILGLNEDTYLLGKVEDMLCLRVGFNNLVNDVGFGKDQNVLFVLPPEQSSGVPLYQMAFMLDTWLRRKNVRDRIHITWASAESSYMQAFGPRANQLVFNEFEERNIRHHAGYTLTTIEPRGARFTNGDRIRYDMLITLPPYRPSLVLDNLPQDVHGYVAVDEKTRRVHNQLDIYAVGDMSDLPLKQAFLALTQADAAAEHLSSRILKCDPLFGFEPMGLTFIEQLDTATFLQAPLQTDHQALAVMGSPNYRVGTSPLWRLGLKLLGVYLPWRFSMGEPLRAGLPWAGMELGLQAMAGALAS